MPAQILRRHGPATSFLAGVASLLVVELVVAGAMLLPAEETVAGTARPAAVAPQEPAAQEKPAPAVEAKPAPAAATEEKPAEEPAEKPKTQPPPPAAPPQGQRPNTIRLPDGGTATLVRKEIVGPNAVLPVPENLGEATWWGAGLGADGGASVFAGHVNWQGRIGPFAELWQAQVNEEVVVKDEAGKEWKYRVSQLVTVHKDELPAKADELFSQGGAHRIVLVTCGGRWLGGSTGYAENRIVIADPA
ncbi:class F sortase [Amycolatopsis palatopharyngis]|uniref:class F sortase n=1 Tax=Amycolatopsis palatopharyngis TaxID=187982 RepID=UPI000E25D52C|nr:class F sortase [Amycolatopsis palatopharyngis]